MQPPRLSWHYLKIALNLKEISNILIANCKIKCSLTIPVYMQVVWINSLTMNASLATDLEACPFLIIP